MVEFITYQGEKYPVRISSYAMEMAQKETGASLGDIESNFEGQKALLWYSLVAGHRMAKKELTLKREDIEWILDECYFEYIEITTKFARAIIEIQERLIEEGKSKKK